MQLGSLFHTICLEPERAEQEYAVAPDGLDRRTKEGKAWVAENVEKQIVSAADWQMVAEMREALLRNTEIAEILKSGVAEQPVRTLHPDLFVGIKAKPDWFDPQSGVILDLKTTTDASPTEFAKSVHKFRYHVQEAFYRDVLAAEGIEVTRFIFAAIEKEYPYLVATYELDDEAVGHGRLLYTQDLAVYAECLERGVWPGYAPTTQRLSLPAYAFR
jgi:exodeoxyribonuclease VIII